jgi:hypothetical protein
LQSKWCISIKQNLGAISIAVEAVVNKVQTYDAADMQFDIPISVPKCGSEVTRGKNKFPNENYNC